MIKKTNFIPIKEKKQETDEQRLKYLRKIINQCFKEIEEIEKRKNMDSTGYSKKDVCFIPGSDSPLGILLRGGLK